MDQLEQERKHEVFRCGQYAMVGRVINILDRATENWGVVGEMSPAEVIEYIKQQLLADLP